MRPLQELHRQLEQVVLGERQMIFQNREFVLERRQGQLQGRLQTGQDVIGNLESRFVIVHRHARAEVRVRRDFDAGDDRLHVSAVVQQGRERGPAFLVHAVALVQDARSARDHGRHQRRGVVGNLPRLRQHRRDQQVLRARVAGALVDV